MKPLSFKFLSNWFFVHTFIITLVFLQCIRRMCPMLLVFLNLRLLLWLNKESIFINFPCLLRSKLYCFQDISLGKVIKLINDIIRLPTDIISTYFIYHGHVYISYYYCVLGGCSFQLK